MLLVLLVVVALAGCSGEEPPAPAVEKSAAAKPQATPQAAAEKLPAVDPTTAIPIGPDGVRSAAPEGWSRAPRSRSYLVRYRRDPREPFPSITVLDTDLPGDVQEVTADNQPALVEAIAAWLAERFTRDGKSTLRKPPAGVRLGERFAVTWSAPATDKVAGLTKPVDEVSYGVLVGGRLYTVALRAPTGRLTKQADLAARAVAAALSLPDPDAQPEIEPFPGLGESPGEPSGDATDDENESSPDDADDADNPESP